MVDPVVIIPAQASSVTVQNMSPTLSPGGAPSAASLMAAAHMMNGGGLQINPDAAETLTALQGIPSTSPMYAEAQIAITNLKAQQTAITANGPTGIVQAIQAAHGHCTIVSNLNDQFATMSGQDFGDLGVGVTNPSSMSCKGLSSFGDMSSLSSLMSGGGGILGTGNMSTFGMPGGIISSLIAGNLGEATGIVPLLSGMGITQDKMTDPTYAPQVSQAMGQIKDPNVLATIADHFGLPAGGFSSIADFLNPANLIPGFSSGGLSLSSLGSKLSDMGASFPNPASAASMFSNISIPSLPSLDGITDSFGSQMSGIKDMMASKMGIGSGPSGIPQVSDFLPVALGTPSMSTFLGGATSGSLADLNQTLSASAALHANAGIPSIPSVPSLSDHIGAAQGLGQMAADELSVPTGAGDVLNSMITPDAAGDSIKAAMATGKNAAVMAAVGIA